MPRCTALIDDLHRMHCRNEPYHTVEASFSSLNELSTQAKSVLHMMHTVVVYCASVHSAGTMQTKCNSTVLFLNLNLPQLFGTLLRTSNRPLSLSLYPTFFFWIIQRICHHPNRHYPVAINNSWKFFELACSKVWCTPTLAKILNLFGFYSLSLSS